MPASEANSGIMIALSSIGGHSFASNGEPFAKKYGTENTCMRIPLHQSPMVDLSIQAKQTLRPQDYFYHMTSSDSVVYDALSRAKKRGLNGQM